MRLELSDRLLEGDLPLPLYFSGNQIIWLLEPGKSVEQITPSDRVIMDFDVWPEDCRIAYGTSGGQLYVMMPNQEPRLLHDVSAETTYPTEIGSVSWSPDGTRLAYTVNYSSEQASREAGYPSYPSGLWLLDMKDATPTWLLSNHYMRAGEVDVNAMRIVEDPIWSPDGTALILTGNYWESSDTFWLDPIAPDFDETNLHLAPARWWSMGSWISDSRSVLLSGYQYATYGDLVQVDRASLKSRQLIKGESKDLWIYDAQELPAGIVFLQSEENQRTRLYLGHRNKTGFEYSPVGPERLCDSRTPRHIEWDSTGRWGVLICGHSSDSPEPNEVHIVTLDGKNINLTPYLGPLLYAEFLTALWGK